MRAQPQLLAAMVLLAASQSFGQAPVAVVSEAAKRKPIFAEPVRLEVDGKPINIGRLSKIAHAGPCVADVDGDGDRDLVVGDFPGYFWLFKNTGDDKQPVYTSKGKLQAGGTAAKTPVY